MPLISGSESDASLETTDGIRGDEVRPIRRKLVSLSISGHSDLPEPVLRVGNRTIYTHGRPPWYDTAGQAKQPFVIGICGGSASGKTTVAREIITSLDVQWVSILSMDSYYKVLSPEERQLAAEGNYNFDHPNSFDFDLMHKHLVRLVQGKAIEVPEYDFKTHSRTSKTITLYGANVIVLEGILAFYSSSVSKLIDLKVFVDTDADERLARRLRRDISERARDLADVLKQYTRFVKPAYEQFIAPSMAYADIIIPRGGRNKVAIQLINQHINKRLKQSGVSRQALVKLTAGDMMHANGLAALVAPWGDGAECDGDPHQQNGDPMQKDGSHRKVSLVRPLSADDQHQKRPPYILPSGVHVLPPTPQALGLHTIMRDQDTQQDAFVFYSERLMRPLCEYAMDLLPHADVTVDTPQGAIYQGRQLAPGTQICGVSIVRSGEALEPSLCAVCKDVRLGKILIQTNPDTFEPELHYLRLPNDIKNCFVILMDSTVATGAAAIMAMRILVEHDVPEDRIILISLLMAIQGVHAVAYTFPKAHIITTAVDGGLNDQFHIVPGMGNFGDRYFGTTADISVS